MKFSEISVKTLSQTAELIAYFMQEISVDGVSIYDKKDLYENPSWDYLDDDVEKTYGEEVIVKGYCNVEDTESVLDFLRERFVTVDGAGSWTVSVNTVDGDAWVENWKSTFKPIETEKLVICPEWLCADSDKTTLLLDTGVAFGTGQHETTSMCIEFAEKTDMSGKRVLDVGCGSGILGLSALLLGAEYAELVDIDSQATDAARHNASINGLDGKCEVKTGNLADKTDGLFDVVFANLTADILALLRRDITKVVKVGGTVILSGILDVKLDYVTSLYAEGFRAEEIKEKGEWRAVKLLYLG